MSGEIPEMDRQEVDRLFKGISARNRFDDIENDVLYSPQVFDQDSDTTTGTPGGGDLKRTIDHSEDDDWGYPPRD